MLTVKHVHRGLEAIYRAPFGVMYHGPNAEFGVEGPCVAIPQADGESSLGATARVLHGGMAYVMNEAGATVGSYRLGEAAA